MWVSSNQISGVLAMWAVRQSPYPCPDNLELVVGRFAELWPVDDLGMAEFSDEQALLEAIVAVSERIPELLAWNERKNGNDAPLGFCSRYDKPDPDNDFIDLDALWRNITRTVRDEEARFAEAA